MNIDIVNQHVSEELGIPLKNVKLVNSFYWRAIKDHVYNYNPQPLNISNICVFYIAPVPLKRQIFRLIKTLRSLKESKKYRKNNSPRRDAYMSFYGKALRNMLIIRKYNKYTN